MVVNAVLLTIAFDHKPCLSDFIGLGLKDPFAANNLLSLRDIFSMYDFPRPIVE
jgi:hypothetical protein